MEKTIDDFIFANNLRKLMNDRKLTGEKLGELIGVGKSTIINWSNGARFPQKEEHIKNLVSALNVSYDDLFWGENFTPITKQIPLIGKASCGEPAQYELNGYEPIPVADDIYKDGMYAIEAEGNSMLPKIAETDILYCISENTMQITNGDIVHYNINDESGVKKYKINEAGTIISLIPLNSDYDIITIHCDEPVDLKLSKVVGRYSKF